MKAERTAGPWTVSGLTIVGADAKTVARVEAGPDCHAQRDDEAKANARLIAASPDLLRVVESVILWDMAKDIGKGKPRPLYPHIVAAARAALEKARAG